MGLFDFLDPGGSAIGLYEGAPDYASLARAQEAERQARITQGQQSIADAFKGFSPDFYNQRAQSYINYAMPQLAQQYRQNQAQTGFGQVNRGIQASSAAAKQWQTLNRAMNQGRQSIADTGLAQANKLRQDVEQQRNILTNQLYQSADPTQAAQQATATAASFATPSTFAPIANMFGDVAQQYYLSQMMNAYRPTSYIQLPSEYYGNANALPQTSLSVRG